MEGAGGGGPAEDRQLGGAHPGQEGGGGGGAGFGRAFGLAEDQAAEAALVAGRVPPQGGDAIDLRAGGGRHRLDVGGIEGGGEADAAVAPGGGRAPPGGVKLRHDQERLAGQRL